VGQQDLEFPLVVKLDQPAAGAAAELLRSGQRWAVVLDDEGALHGWVDSRTLVAGGGLVRDHTRRMEAWIPLGGSLKQAMAEMLTHDAGWVAVLDGGRYLGVLTPATLHSALRHSVTEESGQEQEPSVASLG
jgi:osmoprotectant transport system ATP-binding protein